MKQKYRVYHDGFPIFIFGDDLDSIIDKAKWHVRMLNRDYNIKDPDKFNAGFCVRDRDGVVVWRYSHE